VKIRDREFERLVGDALAAIPEEFRKHLDNVQVVVEEDLTPDLREDLGLEPEETLYGVYEGTALTERSLDSSDFPDRIILFRRPLLEDFRNPDELRREVTRTVLHEVAHHFGMSDKRLAELGWD